MISSAQKKHLKEILGNDYVPKMHKLLREKEIKKSNGEYYSDSSIKAVLNNGSNNIDIEECFYELASAIQLKQAKIEKMRQDLLKGNPTATVQPSKKSD